MQVGMFHEFYGVDNNIEKVGYVKEVSELLNIQMTRKDKKIQENNRKNCLMAGFPSEHIERYTKVLLENNYTVVVIDQKKGAPVLENGRMERVVSRICSPGTYIDEIKRNDNNFLVTIYLTQDKMLYTSGLSAVDLTTGEIHVHEAYSSTNDINYALDETYRFIQAYNPREILLYSDEKEKIVDYLDLFNKVYHHKDKMPLDYTKLVYQNKFLSKVYCDTGMLTPIEHIDLENRPISIITLVAGLQFAYDHDEKIIQKLGKPKIWQKKEHLVLANNAISQLGLASDKNEKSVFTIIDKTSTGMGRRLLKYRLLNPVTDIKILNDRYKTVEDMINTYASYEKHLVNVSDIEKYHRRMKLGILQPMEFKQLHNSYLEIRNILLLKNSPNQMLNDMIKWYSGILDFEEIYKYNLTTISDSFFKVGYNKEIDEISYKIKHYNEVIRQSAARISGMIMKNSDCVKENGNCFNLTANRYKTLEENWVSPLDIKVDNEKYTFTFSDFTAQKVSPKSQSLNIFSQKLTEIFAKLNGLKEEIKDTTAKLYLEFLATMENKYGALLDEITYQIAEIDVSVSCAKISILYNYRKPSIVQNKKSYIQVVNLRHPIIERINTELVYVPHTLSVGQGVDGMIVYGVNSCGKSSLMKAVGISLVLAQAGFYVPAESFTFSPYNNILTRILGNDNIFKGLSSFAVEMSELRGILQRADSNSLILGDEICHGTETISGTAIVASAIRHLSKRESSFIFASHLHGLSTMEEINELKNVKNYHLRVTFDGDKLIYDRNLMEGSGDPIYGLEVAKAMGLDKDFLVDANSIRKRLLNIDSQVLSTRKSHFNNNIYIDKCAVCSVNAEEVHHINFQCNADERGMIKHYHKNIEANLVPLCKKCHNDVHHSKKLIIKGYLLSNEGITLDYIKK
jgi:DNA mismatch repair protein MutS